VTIRPQSNNSLEASGFSGLVIDNLFVTCLSATASNQPLRVPLDFLRMRGFAETLSSACINLLDKGSL
jgi:hypothetical protein